MSATDRPQMAFQGIHHVHDRDDAHNPDRDEHHFMMRAGARNPATRSLCRLTSGWITIAVAILVTISPNSSIAPIFRLVV